MTKINHFLPLSHHKTQFSASKNLRLNLLGSASLALALSLPIAAWAAPQGGVVVGGTANISTSGATTNGGPQGGVVVGGAANITTSGKTTNINQSTNRAAINWNSFNVARDETVNFTVPNRGATLNRVIGGGASLIQGTVRSNGTLYLVNQNGLMFDATSKVYAQNFIATTSNIDPSKFMAGGRVQLEQSRINAQIFLNGEIKAADRGIVGLFAPIVANLGTITANLGQVVLAGAQTAVIDFTGDGLMNFELGESESRPWTHDSEKIFAGNEGVISASGGKVTLTAQGAKDMMNAVVAVNYSGVIDVSSSVHDGSVSLAVVNGNLELSRLAVKANGSVGGNISLSAVGSYFSTFGSYKLSSTFLAASQDITIKTDGLFYLNGDMVVGRDLILQGGSILINKTMVGRDIIANSARDVTFVTSVASGRDIILDSKSFSSIGFVTAGRNIVIDTLSIGGLGIHLSQMVTAGQDIILKSSYDVVFLGDIVAGRDISVNASRHVVSQANITAGRDITLTSLKRTWLDSHNGNLYIGDDIKVTPFGIGSEHRSYEGNIVAGRDIVITSGTSPWLGGDIISGNNITINHIPSPPVVAAPAPAPAPAPVTPPVVAEPAPAPAPVTPPVVAEPTPAPAPVTPLVVVTSKPAPAPVLPPKTITVNIPNATGDQVMVDSTSKANVKPLDSATGSYVVSITSAKAPVSINLSFPDDRANWGNTEPEVTYDAATKLYTTKFIFGKSADGSVPDASKIKVTVNVAASAPKVVNTVANNLANFKMANPAPIAPGGNNSGYNGNSANPLASSPTPINTGTTNTGTNPNNPPDSGNRILVKTRGVTISENSDGGVTTVVNQSNPYGRHHDNREVVIVVTNGEGDATFVGTETTRNHHVYGVTIGSPPAKIPGLNVTTPRYGYKGGYGGYGYGYGDYKYRFTTPSITAGGNIIINGVTVK